MKRSEVEALQVGDEVTWNDPDDGLCSRTDIIAEIDKSSLFRNVVVLTWQDGSGVEAFVWELA